MRSVWVFVVVAVGCVEPSVVVCSDGRVCPANTACDDSHGKCVLPEQLVDCAGASDGTACDIAGQAAVCVDQVCTALSCGDRIVMGSEQCDGAVPADKDDCTEHDFQSSGIVTCKDDCTFDVSSCSGFCGDGILNGSEACDYVGPQLDNKDCTDFGFYQSQGLACSEACTFDTAGCQQYCGDAQRNGDESCDGADLGGASCLDLGYYQSSGLTCNAACSYDASACKGFCGDRITTQDRELCDGAIGFLDCSSFGFAQGPLSCSALCAPDIGSCTSPEKAAWPLVRSENGLAFNDGWGSSPDDIFAVGCTGASPCTAYIEHWNGTTWTPASGVSGLGMLNGVWGDAANNVFAVGLGGTIVRYTGTWSPMTSNTSVDLHDVWGEPGGDVIAVGDNSTVLRYDGLTWGAFPVAFPTPARTLLGIWGISADNFYVVGQSGGIWHYDTGSWTQMTSNTTATLYAIWGASGDEIYAVGATGTVVRLTAGNSQWTAMTSATGSDLRDVTGSGSGDVYAVGTSGTIRHYDGVSWEPMSINTSGQQLYGVWAAGVREIYGFGTSGTISRFTGEGWARRFNPSTESFRQLYIAEDRLLGAGDNRITELPGGLVTISPPLYTVGGSGNQVFAAGAGGTIRQRTGPLTWPTITSPTTQTINDIAWPFAVGSGGTILKFTGSAWDPMTSPTTGNIRRVWAYSDTEAFALGGLGNVYRLSGTTWTAIAKPTNSLIWAVWGTAPDNVFVTGDEGQIYHWNGTSWTTTRTPVQDAIFEIAGTGPGDIFAATSSQVLHYDGLAWSRIEMPITETLYRITPPFVVGSAGTALERRRHCVAVESSCSDGADDDCDGFYDCGDVDCLGDTACANDGLCTGAMPLGCNTSVMGDTIDGVNALTRYACDPSIEHGRELIYKVTPMTSGTVAVTLTAARDLDLIVLAEASGGGCEPRNPGCRAASSNAGGNESVSFQAVADDTYYIVVDGFGANAGAFTLSVTCP